jgi:hypothetical protein
MEPRLNLYLEDTFVSKRRVNSPIQRVGWGFLGGSNKILTLGNLRVREKARDILTLTLDRAVASAGSMQEQLTTSLISLTQVVSRQYVCPNPTPWG